MSSARQLPQVPPAVTGLEEEDEDWHLSQLFPKCTPKATPTSTPTASNSRRTLAESIVEGDQKKKKKKVTKKKKKCSNKATSETVAVGNIIDLQDTNDTEEVVPRSVFKHDMTKMLSPTSSCSVDRKVANTVVSCASIPSSSLLTPLQQSTRIVNQHQTDISKCSSGSTSSSVSGSGGNGTLTSDSTTTTTQQAASCRDTRIEIAGKNRGIRTRVKQFLVLLRFCGRLRRTVTGDIHR